MRPAQNAAGDDPALQHPGTGHHPAKALAAANIRGRPAGMYQIKICRLRQFVGRGLAPAATIAAGRAFPFNR